MPFRAEIKRTMAKEITKVREVTITEAGGVFSIFKKPKTSKTDYDFEGVMALRQLLSNEKARILHTIKNQNPQSIYDLAKKLGRGFKSVNDDIKLLERFGFIELMEEKTKNRIRHRPKIVVDTITIHLKV
jgi:predicted transcriptional regulator